MKVGDTIVCIDEFGEYSYYLPIYKFFIIEKISLLGKYTFIKMKNESFYYNSNRFITMNEYRKMKLYKLKFC